MDLGKRYASPLWIEAFFLLVAAALLSRQLLLPGFIGLANNGDFPKVAGPLCLGGADRETEKFAYFQPDYLRGPAFCYNPQIPSSEIAVAWIASSAERILADKTRFDIRWLGALHALIFMGVYYLLLRVLRPFRLIYRIVLALAGLWIFADVSFVAYLNTFFSDVPAMLGGLAAIFLAVLLARGETINPALLGLFGGAALFFVTSKAQHGILGVIPLGAAIWFAWRSRTPRGRFAGVLAAFAILAGMVWVIARTPGWYTAQSRFNLIFSKIAPISATPALDLRELGLNSSDPRYIGMHAFMPDTPLNQDAFRERFYAHTSYWQVAAFYARHPGTALAILRSDLRLQAPLRRVYSNFPKSYGQPPGAKSERFSSWSALRTRWFVWSAAHIVVWFAVVLLCAPWLAVYARSPFEKAVLWVMVAVAVAAAAEFGVASLADAGETTRHLWIFHVFTDVTLYLALVFAAGRLSQPPNAPVEAAWHAAGLTI